MAEIPYIGNELEVFSHARNWKSYFGGKIKPYLRGKVLEVGAGLGGTTAVLCDGHEQEWLCLEPDPALYGELRKKTEEGELPSCCKAIKGVTADLPADRKFDAILYIDVIEHIEKDREELTRARDLLAKDGHLIVLVPAHQFVYSPFDKVIGHYRRYNKKMLRAAAPDGLRLERMFYLDSTGLMASIVNKLLLKQSYPTLRQIKMWDGKMIPVSRALDPLIGFRTGKALIAIWKKD
jgi:SAM-dependent methyltransferase